MKIRAAQKDLEQALKTASVALAKKGGLESHFVVRLKDDKVAVLTHNQQVLASAPLVCEVTGKEGAFTVEGWRLLRWVSGVGDVALTLESKGSIVTGTSPSGSVRWPSLDPVTFPYWDKGFAKSSTQVTVKAVRLRAALDHTRDFIFPHESQAPHLALTEVQEGVLKSMDLRAFAMVESDVLKGSTLKIHLDQVGPVMSYLASLGDGDVDLRLAGGTLFFSGSDGSVFGLALPLAEFPEIDVDKEDEPDCVVSFRTEDLRRVLVILSTSADKDNQKVRFLWDPEEERASLSMESLAGSSDSVPVPAVSVEKIEAFPDGGFQFSVPHLKKMLDKNPEEVIRFDLIKKVNKKGQQTGLVRFCWEAHGDTYLTAIQWL